VQPCRHTNSETFSALKGLCDTRIYTVLNLEMVKVRENETALRKLSGGTAQLRIFEGTPIVI